MRVIRIAEVDIVPIETATPIPGWTGGEVKRTRQPLPPEGASKTFNSSIVNFEKGCGTGWHTHKSEELGSSGNSIVVAAHPDGMSDDLLIRVRSISDGYLGLRVEQSWSSFNNMLEVFKVANPKFRTGNRVNFHVEPGMGIRVSAITKVNA